MRYKFDGVEFAIDEEKDENGVVLFSCVDDSHVWPVFLRTNGVNMFHYKIGDNDDNEDLEWGCCTSKNQLIEYFVDAASMCDEIDHATNVPNWNTSTNALLHYIEWVH